MSGFVGGDGIIRPTLTYGRFAATDRTLAQLAEQFDVHPNQVTSWKAQLEGSAADVFGCESGSAAAPPAVDVKPGADHDALGEIANARGAELRRYSPASSSAK